MTDPLQIVVTPLAPASTVAVAVADARPQVQVNPQAMADLTQTFETLAQNVQGLPFALQRNAQGRLAIVVYAEGLLVKTLERNSAGQLTAVVLTGAALGQRTLTKQLLRDAAGVLTGASYQAGGTP